MSLGGIFEGIWGGAKSAITSPIESAKNLSKGDLKGAIKPLKHMPGNQERTNSEILNQAGVRGWVGDHPWSIPVAVATSAISAPAFGGSAVASGGTGISSYMAPASAGSYGSPAAAMNAGASSGIGNTNFLLNMGNAGMNAPTATGGATQFTPAMLSQSGAESAQGASGGLQMASKEALGGDVSSAVKDKPFDYELLMRTLNSIVPKEEQRVGQSSVSSGGFRPGFNFDRKLYENPLLTRSYGELYTSPMNR